VVRRTATETLAELDRFVDLIRAGALGSPTPTGGSVHRGPADLLALIERMRTAGLTIEFTMDGTPDGDTGSAVYRIVQEALTNVLRHAPGAHVQVAVRADATGTSVDVLNTGPPPSPDCHRGYGLVGIAERVDRFGGHLTTGPGPDGTGFQVAARIPAPTRTAP
jgi:signal transduction histidine kinase